jgi:hypothetical protein
VYFSRTSQKQSTFKILIQVLVHRIQLLNLKTPLEVFIEVKYSAFLFRAEGVLRLHLKVKITLWDIFTSSTIVQKKSQ